MNRYRLTNESRAVAHPEGEVVLTADHEREVARLRDLMNKVSEYARAWKAYAEQTRSYALEAREALGDLLEAATMAPRPDTEVINPHAAASATAVLVKAADALRDILRLQGQERSHELKVYMCLMRYDEARAELAAEKGEGHG